MQTNFSSEQLKNPRIRLADGILRNCVHCGFCTATCPTYVLGGNELDSPRGRIYQIKEMFETGKPASAQITTHVDRCLSCLSCMTTCPSGVHYMHLVDEARAHITETGKRGLVDRLLRSILAFTLPYPKRFTNALRLANFAKLFGNLLPWVFGKFPGLSPLAAMLKLAPAHLPRPQDIVKPGTYQADAGKAEKKGRVVLLAGCANSVLDPAINAASIRVLNRLGFEVIIPSSAGCCGSLEHHLGREDGALAKVKANVDAWTAELENGGLDSIIINASGCGTTVKDYGHMLRLDAAYKEKAAVIAGLARDISEFLQDLPETAFTDKQTLRVAYHSACSLQHGQHIKDAPRQLLARAGFDVQTVPEGHLCCGSAGVYNVLQHEIADQLKARKIANIKQTSPDVVAAGNIGCIRQLEDDIGVPVLHTIELVDWAMGGEEPAKLAKA